jgi:5'(3')-deoxyribonucleotidase
MDNIALFDMDRSLVDYDEGIINSLNMIVSHDEKKITKENIGQMERTRFTHERIKLIRSQTGWWFNLNPLQEGMKVLDMAREIGFQIHILTKGPKKLPTAWKEKVEWCQKHIGENVDIHITSNKGMVYGKVLYDDYPEYMNQWIKNRPRGLGIMPSHSHNVDFQHPNVLKSNAENIEQVKIALSIAFERKSGEKIVFF